MSRPILAASFAVAMLAACPADAPLPEDAGAPAAGVDPCGGAAHVLWRTGDPAPGLPGAVFEEFGNSPVFGADGTLAFFAYAGGGDVPSFTPVLYVWDGMADEPELLARGDEGVLGRPFTFFGGAPIVDDAGRVAVALLDGETRWAAWDGAGWSELVAEGDGFADLTVDHLEAVAPHVSFRAAQLAVDGWVEDAYGRTLHAVFRAGIGTESSIAALQEQDAPGLANTTLVPQEAEVVLPNAEHLVFRTGLQSPDLLQQALYSTAQVLEPLATLPLQTEWQALSVDLDGRPGVWERGTGAGRILVPGGASLDIDDRVLGWAQDETGRWGVAAEVGGEGVLRRYTSDGTLEVEISGVHSGHLGQDGRLAARVLVDGQPAVVIEDDRVLSSGDTVFVGEDCDPLEVTELTSLSSELPGLVTELFGGADTGGRPIAFRNGTLATRIAGFDGTDYVSAVALVTTSM